MVNYQYVNKCVKYSTARQNESENKYSEINDKLSNLYSIYSSGDMKEEIDQYENNTLVLLKYVLNLSLTDNTKLICC